eukprot:CFRG0620T1
MLSCAGQKLCRSSTVWASSAKAVLTTQSRSYTKRGTKANRTPRVAAVLLTEVPGLGEQGNAVAVAHGYLRNQLLPAGKARYATPKERLELKDEFQASDKRTQKVDSYTRQRDRMAKIFSEFTLEIGQDRPGNFSLDARKLVRHYLSKLKLEVNPESILLPNSAPIRTAGLYTVSVQIDQDTVVDTVVNVKKWPRVKAI